MSDADEPAEAGGDRDALTAAQRARVERNRLRARALRDARLLRNPVSGPAPAAGADSGGGFLLEREPTPPPLRARAAPVVHVADQPRCLECDRTFPQSFLFDNFDYSVCDDCRDDEGEHSLMPRTEAKSEFLLQDCDLDARPPPLRCVRRRNPHGSGRADMRLYLRAQLQSRALLVWGSEAGLRAERERRRAARAAASGRQAARRLRELRLQVRSSVLQRPRATHAHRYGPERYDAADDAYERTCDDCGHVQRYEKM